VYAYSTMGYQASVPSELLIMSWVFSNSAIRSDKHAWYTRNYVWASLDSTSKLHTHDQLHGISLYWTNAIYHLMAGFLTRWWRRKTRLVHMQSAFQNGLKFNCYTMATLRCSPKGPQGERDTIWYPALSNILGCPHWRGTKVMWSKYMHDFWAIENGVADCLGTWKETDKKIHDRELWERNIQIQLWIYEWAKFCTTWCLMLTSTKDHWWQARNCTNRWKKLTWGINQPLSSPKQCLYNESMTGVAMVANINYIWALINQGWPRQNCCWVASSKN
jgi:hypothetical protein